jgi:aminopeptidase-like protein
LSDSFTVLRSVIDVIEADRTFLNVRPYGEPQLGTRGLYSGSKDDILALLWVLNLSDGTFSLLDIAAHSHTPFEQIQRAAGRLTKAGLLRHVQ